MAMLPRIRDLYLPSVYVAADRYKQEKRRSIAGNIEVRLVPVPGLLLSSVDADGLVRESFVDETDIDRALEAALEFRYRLVGGLRSWRLTPLFRRRDQRALGHLMHKHLDAVFPVGAAA